MGVLLFSYCHPQLVIIPVKGESAAFSVLRKRFVIFIYQTLFTFRSSFAVTARRGEREGGGFWLQREKSRCKAGSASPNWGEGITTDRWDTTSNRVDR